MVSQKTYGPAYKWLVLTIILLVHAFAYGYATTSFASLLTTIVADLSLTSVQTAALVSAVCIGVIACTFVAGTLYDKYSPRTLLFISCLICTLGLFLRGMAYSFGMFYAAMIILGVGQAILFPGEAKIIAMWFKRQQIFKAVGVLTAGVPIGMIIGYLTSIQLANAIGSWQLMYRYMAFFILALGIVWLLVDRDIPNEQQDLNKQLNMVQKTSTKENIKALLSMRQVWVLCLTSFVFVGVITVISSYGASILGTFPGGDPTTAALVASLANFGSLTGYFVLPPIAEKFGKKKPFTMIGFLPMAISLPIALISQSYVVAGPLIFASFFFNGWAFPGPKSMLLESPGVAGTRAGTATGLQVMFEQLGGAILPFVFAALVAGRSVITAINTLAIGCTVLCLLLFLFVKETGIGREAAKKLAEERKAAKLASKGA